MRNAPVLLLCTFLLLSTMAFGQQNENRNSNRNATNTDNQTIVDVDHQIELENDSRKDEVELHIPADTREMRIKVYGNISMGKLVINLSAPNGKKEGTFSLSTKGNRGKNSRAIGNLSKALKDPIAGNWIIKIAPEQVTGRILVQSSYYQ